MAVFHHTFSIIKRGGHSCAMATAAYRSGSALTLKTKFTESGQDEEVTFDYSKKPGIGFSSIMTSFSNVPEWIKNRQSFWQYIEDMEDMPHADLACESIFPIPEELTLDQNIDLIQDFVKHTLLPKGMIVDVNIHMEHKNNPHAHLMSSLRPLLIDNEGNYSLGEKDPQFVSKETIDEIEKDFAMIANKHLEKNGFDVKISNTSKGLPRYDQLRPWL